jgi:acyl carrier protein
LAAAHFKVPREKLSPDDDFFKTLGIDSLQTLDLLTKLENHFHVELAGLRTAGSLRFSHAGGKDSGATVGKTALQETEDFEGNVDSRHG